MRNVNSHSHAHKIVPPSISLLTACHEVAEELAAASSTDNAAAGRHIVDVAHMAAPPVAQGTHMVPPVAEAGEGTSRDGVAD